PGEFGETTIRFIELAPGGSPADTSASNWSAPVILASYMNNLPSTYGWSGSEHLRVANAEYLGGFTAWASGKMGIAYTRMAWTGSDFTLVAPSVTSVDEYRSPARGLTLSVLEWAPRASRVRLRIESPLALAAKLEVFDVQGRCIATPFDGPLAAGRTDLAWDLKARGAASVASGVYFARLRFAGGSRTARIVVAR
ncbi:MAG: T9SS type A sorting domain-containing protein, partial [Candidatus Eisenbacteria bacterium]|nr:T9SS type A sorting domain-containing protein [Candidatus Eisenbacteria bacterium]